MKIKCGIYKITNPEGKVYVGQSVDINARWEQYKRLNCKKQKNLFNSFCKYGYSNHIFEIITECDYDYLNELEKKYISQYNCCEIGLNIMNGNSYKKLKKEIKIKKIKEDSIIPKQYGRTHSKLKTYRFSEKLIEQLSQLEKYSIVESKFVRLAIEEKIKRDLPQLEKEYQKKIKKIYCPF